MSQRSYAEVKAESETEEASRPISHLSVELDRMQRNSIVGRYWREMERNHGRKAAELELMFAQGNIEIQQTRQAEKDAKEKRQGIISVELDEYLVQREQISKQPGCTYPRLHDLDAAFIADQEAKGHSSLEWLSPFGDSIFSTINRIQGLEETWREERAYMAARRAKEDQVEHEYMQKLASMIARAHGAETERILSDLIKSGMWPHDRK